MKYQVFSYILQQLLIWNNSGADNDLSKLKVLKLHFLVCSQSRALLDVFSNFYALPRGPVESTILNAINNNDPELIYSIDGHRTTLSPEREADLNNSIESVNTVLINEVNERIKHLKARNPNLIKCDAEALVEITHKWFAWEHYYKQAVSVGKKSHRIPVEAILNEPIPFYS